MIATGYLQIETYIEHAMVLPNCMVRIFSDKDGYLNYEDFFMTDSMGKTIIIPLYVGADQSSGHEIECPYEIYHVEIRDTGYQTQVVKGIVVYAEEVSYMPVIMAKTDSLSEETITLLKESSSSCSLSALTFDSKLEIPLLPDRVIVSDGTQKNEIPFLHYLKNCMSSFVDPCWSSEIVKAFCMMLTSVILKQLTYHENLQVYEIKRASLPYQAHRNIYMKIDRLVDDVFGYYVICNNNDIDRIRTIFKYPHRMQSYIARGYSVHTILQKIFGKEVVIQRLEHAHSLISPFTQIQIHDAGPIVTSVQEKLQRIKAYYPKLEDCACSGTYDAHTQAAVRSFQQYFHLKVDGILGKRTYYKISFLDEWLYTRKGNGASMNPLVNNHNHKKIIEHYQKQLQHISMYYHEIPSLTIDGIYGQKTFHAVLAFQQMLSIPANGNVDAMTKKLLQQMDDELFP